MRPLHGLNRPKPASASQFFVTQSSLAYTPGKSVTVEIMTHSNERYFRGFLVQAYDPSTGANIGQFLPSTDARSIESCSSSTHRNNQNKRHVSLVWLPPSSGPASASLDQTLGDWIGLRSPISLSVSTNQKRQLSAAPGASNSTANSRIPLPTSAPTATANAHGNGSRQVRFRATIVVSYQEYYTGFESSELSFEKFGYSNGSTGTSAANTTSVPA